MQGYESFIVDVPLANVDQIRVICRRERLLVVGIGTVMDLG